MIRAILMMNMDAKTAMLASPTVATPEPPAPSSRPAPPAPAPARGLPPQLGAFYDDEEEVMTGSSSRRLKAAAPDEVEPMDHRFIIRRLFPSYISQDKFTTMDEDEGNEGSAELANNTTMQRFIGYSFVSSIAHTIMQKKWPVYRAIDLRVKATGWPMLILSLSYLAGEQAAHQHSRDTIAAMPGSKRQAIHQAQLQREMKARDEYLQREYAARMRSQYK